MSAVFLTQPSTDDLPDPDVVCLVPPGSSTAMLRWPLPPDELDVAIDVKDADLIIGALLQIGRLAFRWDEPSGSEKAVYYPEPERPRPAWRNNWLGRRLFPYGLADPGYFGALETSDAHIARGIFEWPGWSLAMQAVLIFDPVADRPPIITPLQRGLDWQSRELPRGARLLFGSGHDGAFAVVSARSTAVLLEFEKALDTEFARRP